MDTKENKPAAAPTTVTTVTATIALVVFASEDLWSSLQSIAYFQERDGLDGVFIYQTAERCSAAPAERLRRFCSRRWPTLRVVLPGEPGAATAAKVAERVGDWRRFRPHVTRWVIDATGATRTMLGGVAKAMAADKVFETICRDGEGVWSALRVAGVGQLDAAPLAHPIPPDATDGLPVTELVELLAADVAEIRFRESRAPEALTPEQIGRLVTVGSKCNWDWSRMYAVALERPGRLEEFTFADFVAAALLAMGIRNVRVNLGVVQTGAKRSETTLDVLVNRCGRLYLFDCRARDEQRDPGPPTPLLTLEGLWPTCVVLRPNRWATDGERLLAGMGSRMYIMDADGCRRLFSWLAEIMGVAVPAVLRDLERGALRLGVNRLPVFTPATQAQRLGDAVRLDDQVFDLVKGGRVEEGGQDTVWRAARVTPDLWFLEGRVLQGGVGGEMQRRLAARFVEHKMAVTIVFFELMPNKRFWHALVRNPGDNGAFTKLLHKWQNIPLIV
jgi:hypothetical protein